MTFHFFTERSNVQPAKSLGSRLAQVQVSGEHYGTLDPLVLHAYGQVVCFEDLHDCIGWKRVKQLNAKWATTWQNQQNDCVPSEDSDQPGHPPSLIRVLTVRMKKAWVLSYPMIAHLIWVFAGRTLIMLILSCRGSNKILMAKFATVKFLPDIKKAT